MSLPSTLSQRGTSADPFIEDGGNALPMKVLLHGKLSEIIGGEKDSDWQDLELATVASGANVDSDAVPPLVEDEHELEFHLHRCHSNEPPDTQTCVLYDELYNLLPEFREFCDRCNNGEPVDDGFNLEAAGCAQLEGNENNGTGFHSNFSQALEVQSTGNTVVDLVKESHPLSKSFFKSLDSPGKIFSPSNSQPYSISSSQAIILKPTLVRSRPTNERALALTAEIHLLDKIRNRLEQRQWHLLQRAHNAGGDSAEDEL
ncbi:hypothetical protein H0H92_009574 [Tricholoma furcatifolium]|nr:hypothetical protein H0H92_009574 [Tricholoma furcatifolium]